MEEANPTKDPEEQHEEWMPKELAPKERQRDPYGWFKKMRDQGAVRYDESRDAFDVFRYDEAVEIMQDHERFTMRDTTFLEGAMMDHGPPKHTELREMAEPDFRPGSLREYRPTLERRAGRILDEALSGEDTIDFVEEIAKPLPIITIADMLGVPSEKMDTFREWSLILAESPSDMTEAAKQETEQRKMRAMEDISNFFRKEIEKREQDPQDDLITRFLQGEKESDWVERSNTIAQCGMMLIGGNITTVSYMSNAMWTFLEEDVISDLQDGRLEMSNALEEVLRYRSPVINAKRWAKQDTELAGVDIHEGARVIAYIPSANRDERVFEHPEQFRPDQEYKKQPRPFGAGVHFCIGAPLANMEAEIMLSKFLDRIETAELLTDQIEPTISTLVNAPAKLPIRVTT